jgi:tRNA-dihydrouridine synthase B
MNVGSLRLDGNLILAPMAGYSDIAMRVLCRRNGASLVCSEMVHSSAVNHDNVKTRLMMRIHDQERPTCVQLFGSKPEEVAASCLKIEPNCDVIGFNFGCPAQQIRVSGCGAVLLDHPEMIAAIVSALRASTKKPLLMKMRLGNMKRADFVDIALSMQENGADAVIVHGRTAKEGYSGHADWSAIAEIKKALSIPVIANGDIIDGPSAERCLKVTKADGLAIGRASLGDPGVFSRIMEYLDSGKIISSPAPQEKQTRWKEYLALASEAGLQKQQILQQAMVFTKGVPGAAKLRAGLSAGNLK